MRRVVMVLAALTVAACGGSGGDGGDGGETSPRTGTPTATPTATATPAATPAPFPAKQARALRRCVALWNRDVRRAEADRAHALLGKRVRDGETLTAAVTLYRGKRLDARRSPCVVVVSVEGRPVPPFSPVKGSRAWATDCTLVRARLKKNERQCPAYGKKVLEEPNVTIDERGRLSAG